MSENTNSNFDFPDIWADDVRMAALFSPFRPKSVNPENYQNKLEFWENLIYSFCKAQKNPKISKQNLENNFKRKNKIPNCLDLVVQDLFAKSAIRRETDFLWDPTNGWTAWAINNFVTSPLKWSFSKIITVKTNPDDSTSYIHVAALKELAEELKLPLKNIQGKVYSFNEFKEILNTNSQNFSDEGLKICLFYLHFQKQITLDYVIDKDIKINIIKIPGKNDTTIQLTNSDRSIIQLQETRKILLKDVQQIEKEIKENDIKIRQCIRDSNKKIAKIYLKKKHNLEKNCDKKSDILHNIEVLISNIEDAQSNGEILNAYKMGSETLKTLTSKSGLSLDNVDEIMLTMKEVLDENQEIQHTMANIDASDINDSALEQELEDLMNSEELSDDDDNNSKPDIDIKLKNNEYEKELADILDKLSVENLSPTSTVKSLYE